MKCKHEAHDLTIPADDLIPYVDAQRLLTALSEALLEIAARPQWEDDPLREALREAMEVTSDS